MILSLLFAGSIDKILLFPGVSDAFCATTRSYSTRNSKIEFEEVMFEKGKMFSLSDGDFQVQLGVRSFKPLKDLSSDSKIWVLQFPNLL